MSQLTPVKLFIFSILTWLNWTMNCLFYYSNLVFIFIQFCSKFLLSSCLTKSCEKKRFVVMSKSFAKLIQWHQITFTNSVKSSVRENLAWAREINWWLLIIWSDSIIYLRYFPFIVSMLSCFFLHCLCNIYKAILFFFLL